MLPTILKGALLQQHIDKGLELYEPDDRLLVLRHGGNVINTYHVKTVAIQQIRKDAYEYLERIGK